MMMSAERGQACIRRSGRPCPRRWCGPGRSGRRDGRSPARCKWRCGRGPGGSGCGWGGSRLSAWAWSQGPRVMGVSGVARRPRWSGARWSGAGWSGAGRGVAAGEAGVGGGGAVGVQGGDAPAGAGVAGCGGGQVAGVVAVEQAEPGGFAGSVGPALVGGQGDGDGDQGGQARAGHPDRDGARDPQAAAPARTAGTVRAVSGPWPGPDGSLSEGGWSEAGWSVAGFCRWRGGPRGDGAAVAFLQQVEVGLDPQFLQGAGDAGGAQVQGALLDVLPGGQDLVGGEFAGDHAGVAGLLLELADVRLPPGGFLALAGNVGVQGQDQLAGGVPQLTERLAGSRLRPGPRRPWRRRRRSGSGFPLR